LRYDAHASSVLLHHTNGALRIAFRFVKGYLGRVRSLIGHHHRPGFTTGYEGHSSATKRSSVLRTVLQAVYSKLFEAFHIR
jgi:hypothetical protein